MSVFGKQILTQNPMRIISVLQVQSITVLNNAARFDGRQIKCFCQVIEVAYFHEGPIENIAVELNGRAVWLDGARPDVCDLVDSLEKGYFYVPELATSVGQDLDSIIILFVNSAAAAVIAVHLAIQDN